MYYCGVCKSIGRQYGHIKRFGLVNEMGMLALLLDCISGKSEDMLYDLKPCIAHPFKKSPAVVQSVYTDYGADVNVMFAYFKLIDSWQDDRNILSALGAKIAFKRAASKAGSRNQFVYNSIRDNIARLNQAEREKANTLDEVSHFFSSLMRDIFIGAPGIKEEIKSDSEYDTEERLVSLKNLGYYIGKWIYLIDALYDLEEDIKHKSYNPIVLRYNYTGEETISAFKGRIKPELEFILHDALGNCTKAWNILSEDLPDTPRIRDAKGFMENVLYMGMRAKTMKGFLSNEPI